MIALALFVSLLLLGGYVLGGIMWYGVYRAAKDKKFWELVYLGALTWLWTGALVLATWGTWAVWVIATVGL